ncbi:MAG: hypothetical protein HOQ22_07270 [Nocardioidaceae bacterium]|nr:hypothetical protein [Nocardioidaceae bacterium]NUS50826.1 hypothetical protein [Nocardioidaceae bacterium]
MLTARHQASRTARRIGSVAAIALGATMLGGALDAASADCTAATGCGGGVSTPSTSGHTITVQVSGSFVSGGSSGSGGTTSVAVPSPCWYEQGYSGKEYAEWVDSGEAAAIWHHTGGDADGSFEAHPDYQKHANDDDGHWYGGSCSSETFGDDLDSFFAYSDKWFADHETVWVPAGGQPPTPPVPPTILRDAALKAMTLPEPTFDWNPKAQGAASLVNLDTWFWLRDNVDNGSVTASAGGNSVTVGANRESVTFSAPDAGAVDCADGGTAWSDGATSDCVLYFRRASAGAPVTAQSHWGVSWTANGRPMGALDPIDATDTANVRVIEVQTVNRAG